MKTSICSFVKGIKTFLQYPEVTAKAMNKEERNSPVLPIRKWTASLYCRARPQEIHKKYGKYKVIFDSSTQTSPEEIVLNHMMPTDHEAIIDFGRAKRKLLTTIYNWHISYPDEIIYLALGDVITCFCFPRISVDVTGAFGFIAGGLYFILTSHVFSSNTLANSWEAFQLI